MYVAVAIAVAVVLLLLAVFWLAGRSGGGGRRRRAAAHAGAGKAARDAPPEPLEPALLPLADEVRATLNPVLARHPEFAGYGDEAVARLRLSEVDSVTAVETMMALEERFDIAFDDDEADNMDRFEDIVRCVAARKSSPA